MNTVGTDSESNICTGIDKQPGLVTWVLMNDFECVAGEPFEFTGGEILFPQLNVVDTGASRFCDLEQEVKPAPGFIPRERGAIGDVVENGCGSHCRKP